MDTAEPHKTPITDETLRQFGGYNLKRAYLLIRQDMMRALEPTGLRIMTFSSLSIISENPNLTQSQLAKALNIERSGVVVLVDELENADLISRNRVKGDRRSYALQCTPKGEGKLAKAQDLVAEHENKMFADLTSQERDTLRDLLARVDKRQSKTED
ncbi:DNA-binding MarR family transcriptional regulator [Pacificibacter maritimus]|uniref:DNA-binding MarR family transcriptional regulator n=1 Tax=Pacificibacter maritimus TaxID=762213 RepID=A0A3N4U8F4_9RHOB|nr:MarR family transcriptional regulator [Pacificibacter maritimus]RPE67026.1 DNA-binding MarR family transcriptional regulator [Pacificibacter maritimus]